MNTLRKELDRDRSYVFFTFPEDARWNAARQAVEFGVEIGEYRDVVSVRRRVFQRLYLGDHLLPGRDGYCAASTEGNT